METKRPRQTSFRLKHIATIVLIALSIATDASAQTSARPASNLEAALSPGESVWITESTGREEKTRIVAVSGDVVTITTPGGAIRHVRTADIVRVRARRSDSLLNGALIGAGVALGSGLFICRAMEPWETCFGNAGSWLQSGAFGAGIGIGVDALIRGRRTIYDAREGAPQLQVAPIVGRHAAGLRVSVTF